MSISGKVISNERSMSDYSLIFCKGLISGKNLKYLIKLTSDDRFMLIDTSDYITCNIQVQVNIWE